MIKAQFTNVYRSRRRIRLEQSMRYLLLSVLPTCRYPIPGPGHMRDSEYVKGIEIRRLEYLRLCDNTSGSWENFLRSKLKPPLAFFPLPTSSLHETPAQRARLACCVYWIGVININLLSYLHYLCTAIVDGRVFSRVFEKLHPHRSKKKLLVSIKQ